MTAREQGVVKWFKVTATVHFVTANVLNSA